MGNTASRPSKQQNKIYFKTVTSHSLFDSSAFSDILAYSDPIEQLELGTKILWN